jgi:DNA polymerase III subunit beta
MKLKVTQENLHKALGNVSRVANTKGTLPILSNVLLKTVGKRLSISATNLDIAIAHFVGSKVEEEGSITVPARLMQEFVSSLPSETITLELDENKLHINTDNYQSSINGVSAEDFPVMPAITKGKTFDIEAQDLKTALSQVLPAASTDEARPVLTGVYLHVVGKKLTLVATDSYRLAEKTLGTAESKLSLLVPASALQDLLRILGDEEGTVSVTHDDQQVQFKFDDVELVARLIEGSYPDYKTLIPKEFSYTAVLPKTELVNITKVSSLFARESAGSITLNLDSKKQTVSIHSVASQLGENTATAKAQIEGDGAITLNSRYLLDALSAVDGTEVKLGFNSKLEPCVVRSTQGDDYLHVVMPLKS